MDHSGGEPMHPRRVEAQHLTDVGPFAVVALAPGEAFQKLGDVGFGLDGLSSGNLRASPFQELQ